MPLHAGQYAYYFDLGEFGTQMPETLVELIERHDDGYWTVQYPVGYRLRKHADSLIGINDNRMLPWANKAEIIKTRNLARFADWRIGEAFRRNMAFRRSTASHNRSNRRNRRSTRRNRRSRRGGAYNVRPHFHIGQRVEVKWLNERGGFSWQPATVTRISYKADGEYHLITFELDRMPGHYHQTPEYVRPLNNNAMAVN